ncbi:MAG: hypothetical protein RXR44_07720, partial [Vulcanisaeta sp.]
FTVIRPMNTTVTFLITYTDQFGQVHSIYYTVPVEIVTNATQFITPTTSVGNQNYHYHYHRQYHSHAVIIMIIIAVVAIIVIITLILLVRRRRHGRVSQREGS